MSVTGMGFLKDFLHQKVPKPGKEVPLYYRRALVFSNVLLSVYFFVCLCLFPLRFQRWVWMPAVTLVLSIGGIWTVRKIGIRANLLLFAAVCLIWSGWNIYAFGWNGVAQQFLTLLLVMALFNVYESPVRKMIWFGATLAVYGTLFAWSQNQEAVFLQEDLIYQTLNAVSAFLMLAGNCVIFSSSVQDTERQLRIRNQTLYKEAGTDALTGLPNRRSMIETIERFRQAAPGETFSVAIADLDFFKRVNDTYGHNCGDYTLVKLTELFRAHAGGQYGVCRWGGEEFCFFMPGKNLDEAGILMNDLCFAVERMSLTYEGNTFSVTVTIGVEEYDFASPLEELLKAADEKLYMGKEAGRNRVVV